MVVMTKMMKNTTRTGTQCFPQAQALRRVSLVVGDPGSRSPWLHAVLQERGQCAELAQSQAGANRSALQPPPSQPQGLCSGSQRNAPPCAHLGCLPLGGDWLPLETGGHEFKVRLPNETEWQNLSHSLYTTQRSNNVVTADLQVCSPVSNPASDEAVSSFSNSHQRNDRNKNLSFGA